MTKLPFCLQELLFGIYRARTGCPDDRGARSFIAREYAGGHLKTVWRWLQGESCPRGATLARILTDAKSAGVGL